MKFSSMLLYVNDEFPNKDVFERLLTVSRRLYEKGKFLYTINQELVDDSYFWMYFEYDNEHLYSHKVIDTSDNSEKPNPRPKSQVETRYQLFACYDLNQKLLYVSDYTKRTVITDYIGDMLGGVTVTAKNVLKSIDDFVALYKNLKAVTFTQRNNIFSTMPGSIFNKQANIYGLDLPERFKLKVDYGHAPTKIAKHLMQEWKAKHDSGEFEEIIVVGVDDSGFESSFNFSTMIATIDIELLRDDNDRYDPNSVLTLLLSKLRG